MGLDGIKEMSITFHKTYLLLTHYKGTCKRCFMDLEKSEPASKMALLTTLNAQSSVLIQSRNKIGTG